MRWFLAEMSDVFYLNYVGSGIIMFQLYAGPSILIYLLSADFFLVLFISIIELMLNIR